MMDDRARALDFERSEQLDYWLRRAEEESIAAIRSTIVRVSRRETLDSPEMLLSI